LAASHHRQRPIDVHLLDLSATLRESERSAKNIERTLALVERDAAPASVRYERQAVEQIVASSRALMAEARKLVQTVRDGRALLDELQGELKRLRRG
jgi:hypothetical protein